MIEYDADLMTFRNLHEWSRRGVASFLGDLQGAPVTMIAWLHRHLVAMKAVMIADVDGLPSAAQILQTELRRQGVLSALCVPIAHEGHLKGFFGFDAVLRHRRWDHVAIDALFQCGELIGLARYGEGATRLRARPIEQMPLIYLRSQKKVRGVEPGAIVCLRSSRNYTEVHLMDGSCVVDIRPLGIWSSLLPTASFVRIHRTAIVSLLHIRGVDRSCPAWRVQMRNLAGSLPVSRPYRRDVRLRLGV